MTYWQCQDCVGRLTTFFLTDGGIAEYQSAMVNRLREASSDSTNQPKGPAFVLTVDEERVMNRGRNAAAKTNHRKTNPAAYQDATALEALLGYLYISDRPRCTQLLQWIEYHLDRIEY